MNIIKTSKLLSKIASYSKKYQIIIFDKIINYDCKFTLKENSERFDNFNIFLTLSSNKDYEYKNYNIDFDEIRTKIYN